MNVISINQNLCYAFIITKARRVPKSNCLLATIHLHWKITRKNSPWVYIFLNEYNNLSFSLFLFSLVKLYLIFNIVNDWVCPLYIAVNLLAIKNNDCCRFASTCIPPEYDNIFCLLSNLNLSFC